MTPPEDKNVVIGRFMGEDKLTQLERTGRRITVGHGKRWKEDETRTVSYVRPYNSDWNALMSVVKKINDLCDEKKNDLSILSMENASGDKPTDDPNHWKSWSYHRITLSTDINHVFQAVVSFIEWYNRNTEKREK